MYTVINRRTIDPTRQRAIRERAQREYFPTLQQASGFVGMYLVADAEQGMNVVVIVWQDKASADAFRPQAEAWGQVLESMGSHLESTNRGETVGEITPQQ